MDVKAEKLEIIRLLLEVEDLQTLREVKSILLKENDCYDSLPASVKNSIDADLKDTDEGRFKEQQSLHT